MILTKRRFFLDVGNADTVQTKPVQTKNEIIMPINEGKEMVAFSFDNMKVNGVPCFQTFMSSIYHLHEMSSIQHLHEEDRILMRKTIVPSAGGERHIVFFCPKCILRIVLPPLCLTKEEFEKSIIISNL